jgi:hypothetical protein
VPPRTSPGTAARSTCRSPWASWPVRGAYAPMARWSATSCWATRGEADGCDGGCATVPA